MGRSGLAFFSGLLLLGSPSLARAEGPSQPRAVIPVEEVKARPDGYRREQRVRTGYVISGAVVTATGALMLYTGIQQRADLASNSVQQAPGSGGEVFLIGGGLALAVGLPLLGYGLLSPRDVYVRDKPVKVSFGYSPRRQAGQVSLTLAL